MKTLVALLLLSTSAVAQDFSWATNDPFAWSITEKGGGPDLRGTDVTSSSAGQVSETPALESLNACVQSIEVYHGGSADIGSAVHIGDGLYLTCKHVFTDDYWRPWPISSLRIAGRNVEHDAPRLHPTLDVAVVQTNRRDQPSAKVGVVRPATGTALTVIGAMTDVHDGTALDTNQDRMIVQSATKTTNGDSGAPVFDAAGAVVGVQSGSLPGEIYFTPLESVAALVAPFTPTEGRLSDKPQSAADDKRTVSIISPKTWGNRPYIGRQRDASGRVTYAGDCPYCEDMKEADYSNQPYVPEFIQADGHESYPHIEWQGANGRTQILSGYYTPWQVGWSVRETMK